jgi:hypothetical protein
MTATLAAPDLAAAAEAVTASAGTATLPGAGLARLIVDDSGCSMQAKGNEVQATSLFDATLMDGEGFELYVPARRVATMLAALGEVDIEIRRDGDVLTIHSPRSDMTVQGVAPDDDQVPSCEDTTATEAPWWRQLGAIAYAASEDQSKPALRSIQLAEGWAFCTDSYRIAAHRSTYEGRDLVIPAELIREANVVCGGVERVAEERGALYAWGPRGWVRSSLIEAPPLAWGKLTPPDAAKLRGSFSAEAMLDALRICRTAVEDASHGNARIEAKALDGAIQLSVGTKGSTLSAVAAIDGDGLEFVTSVFNPAFLTSAVAQIGHNEDQVFFHQIDRTRFSFAMFTSTERAADADELAVVVPYSI